LVADALSTTVAVALAIALGWALGPTLGRWSTHHRLARFLVGLLTELRMLPILVALVPVLAARFGLPTCAVVGLIGGASRTAVVARWMSHAEPHGQSGAESLGSAPRHSGGRFRLRGAAGASMLEVTFEVALLEGVATFFGDGRGAGLGAELAQGRFAAVFPLVALAAASTVLLDRSPARLRRRAQV
jgi:hypothetical protein